MDYLVAVVVQARKADLSVAESDFDRFVNAGDAKQMTSGAGENVFEENLVVVAAVTELQFAALTSLRYALLPLRLLLTNVVCYNSPGQSRTSTMK